MSFKQLISNINTWKEFKDALEPLSKQEKGNAFEELTKYFLQCSPAYRDLLKNVWLFKEIPSAVFKKLNIPSNDQGIDLIAETKNGEYWAIQCKYLQEENNRLSHRTISTFTSLSKGIAKNISYSLVATTADNYAKLYQGIKNIGFINADEWNKLDKAFFDQLRKVLSGKSITYKPYKPKKHQLKAILEAKKYFLDEKQSRGKLVFPCGAGKSLTGYWLKQELKAQSTIVAVPSLSLVKQTLEVYLRESVANKERIEWLCVCSDEGIGKNDDVVIHTNEIGVPCITDVSYIGNWLKRNKNNKTVIFTTYQSGKVIAQATKLAKAKFDLGIMDEAHKTVGNQDKLFSHLLFDKNIKIDRRIFMTATERRYAGSSDNILSMDDEGVYGQTFTQMPFKEAISEGILSDYKIITLFISDKEVKEIIEKNAFVKPSGKDWDQETEARTLASLIALRKAMKKLPIHHAVSFHSSIKKAEAFQESQELFTKAFPAFKKIDSFHVSGSMPTSQRSKIVNEFASSKKAIITNAKCLTEGVDVPNIDCVLFADPRKSTVDIVQAVGRALRKKEGKQFGYVILPVFTKSNKKEEIIESVEFKEILSTLRALASNDERIIEFFRDKNKKGKTSSSSKNGLVQFDLDVNLIEQINEKDLIQSLQLKTWDKLAKLSWMPFEEAREYVRGLKLLKQNEWNIYAKSERKPLDIPSSPNRVYLNEGWKNMGDWLGTGRQATKDRIYWPFEKSKKYVQKVGLKNEKEWKEYTQSGKLLRTIPAAPHSIYKEKWLGIGDWLGTGSIAPHKKQFMSFQEARQLVRKLHLKSQNEWKKFCKSKLRPINLPSNPNKTYISEGWVSYGDFLGTGIKAPGKQEYLKFIEAQAIVRKLNFATRKQWEVYCKSGNKPENIPSTPHYVYKNSGWKGISDWLGTGKVSRKEISYRDFKLARKYVWSLNIKTQKSWYEFCKKGNRPNDIPRNPERVYKKQGWISYGDWLGNGAIANQQKTFLSFEQSKKIVAKFKINSQQEWKKICAKGEKPKGIPSDPYTYYQHKGWKGWADFLGKEK